MSASELYAEAERLKIQAAIVELLDLGEPEVAPPVTPEPDEADLVTGGGASKPVESSTNYCDSRICRP